MKEKELRLALVCYGGVSLALYEHGITKEILNLVRASRAYHAIPDVSARQAPTYRFAPRDGDAPDSCTEEVYFDLLKAIGAALDLRVVVDVIAGSSAGGVNGITLARALAHDLTLDPLTDMWLSEADIQRLLAPEAKARQWSKWYFLPFITPLLGRLGREGVLPAAPDLEMRSAISTFLRSRWFHPPLDGPGFTARLLTGLQAMGGGRSESGSLLPAGHRLDLVVTVTDFYGSARAIFVHDPPIVREREHRHVLRFAFEHPPGGAPVSDFGRDHVPSLAFAARATASYPGAFPPAQLGEMDGLLARRREAWPGRGRFIAANFRHYTDAGLMPEDAVLVDGSVLNNKPLSETIAAARTHSAFREVDRRLVYIDPHPYKETARPHRTPGFFATLRGALSDLPRNEPIYDELAQIDAFNDQIRQRRAVVEATRDQVSALVTLITGGEFPQEVDEASVRQWRLNGPRIQPGANLSGVSWLRLMTIEAIKVVAQLICQACAYPEVSPRLRWIEEVIDAWARSVGIYSESRIHPPVRREAELPLYARFVANFSVFYKKRRNSFIIQSTNRLYHRAASDSCYVASEDLDVVKRRLYRSLDALNIYDDAQFLSAELMWRIQDLFGRLAEVDAKDALPNPEVFVQEHRDTISSILDRLGDECDLAGLDEELDALLASPSVAALGAACQRELLISYIGYLFWDMVLLPMVPTGSTAITLEEIRVDRISPEDAASLRVENEGPILRGGTLAGFGGFFSRSTRENDYLWGRLNAVDRLFDILASTAAKPIADAGLDIAALKTRALACVLRQEAPRLTNVGDLISRLQAAVEKSDATDDEHA
ncbi:patatin-like protein [Phenylobacterium sp. LjRoot225]|uniref:patatin-like protein n=1 Tax=Phenylobacterium sp. LjRoot225 TaxID=3342285 RepID=UPI003ECCAC92